VGPRAGLDAVENSLTRAVQPVARRYTDSAIPTPKRLQLLHHARHWEQKSLV
jgi:hypothetical protein